MIIIKDAVRVTAALVLKFCDFTTGQVISGEAGLKVVSGDGYFKPVMKTDGYFVFMNNRPEQIRVLSDKYRGALISTQNHLGTVLRLSLVPNGGSEKYAELDDESHIGFGGGNTDYAVNGFEPNAVKTVKNDLSDITDLYCVLTSPDGTLEAAYVTRNLGGGKYALRETLKNEFPERGTRLIPLYRVAGGKVPIPNGVKTVYILSGGILKNYIAEDLIK